MQIKGIILASSSPFRQALLKALGVSFRTVHSPFDEKLIDTKDVRLLARERATGKGGAVAKLHPDFLVIGADQTLSFEGCSFEKANDIHEARKRLEQLSGNTHYLHSALVFSVFHEGQLVELSSSITDIPMAMRQLTKEEISGYLALGEWQGVVGCYQAENRGAHLFSHSLGDTSAIMGLPQVELTRMLREIGINILVNPTGPWDVAKS